MVNQKQLGFNTKTKIIHVDDYSKQKVKNHDLTVTYCGMIAVAGFLTKKRKTNFTICKKCSKIYRRKYDHTLESFIITLKLQNKLFI